MNEFEYRFLWKEYPAVAELVALRGMAVVCHEALGPGQIVRFSLDHVMRYLGNTHVYFEEDVGAVRTLSLPGQPELPVEFTANKPGGTVPTGERMKSWFRELRERLAGSGARLVHKNNSVIVSDRAIRAVRDGLATTGDAALDERLPR